MSDGFSEGTFVSTDVCGANSNCFENHSLNNMRQGIFAALPLLSSITHVNLYHAAVEAQKYAILSTFDLNDRLAGFALLISWRGHQPFAVPELWRREWRDSDPSPHTTTDLYSLAASFR